MRTDIHTPASSGSEWLNVNERRWRRGMKALSAGSLKVLPCWSRYVFKYCAVLVPLSVVYCPVCPGVQSGIMCGVIFLGVVLMFLHCSLSVVVFANV